jgi:FlaA1/EpsC-like NDP-sugar epimerase
LGVALIFAGLFGLCGMLFSAQRVNWSRAEIKDALNLFAACGLATFIMLVLNDLFGGGQPVLPPAMLLTAAGLSLTGFLGVRYRGRLLGSVARRWLRLRGGGARAAQERVLIIGSGETGQFAAWLLTNGRSSGRLTVAGFIDDDLHKQGLSIRGLPVLGGREDIPLLVQEFDVGILVFAIHNIAPPERQRLLDLCAATKAHLVMMPDVLGVFNQASGTSARGYTSVTESVAYEPADPVLPDEITIGNLGSKWELDAMLVELEGLVEAGDLPALRQRLFEIRQGRQD